MAEKLGVDNVEQKLIGSRTNPKRPSGPAPARGQSSDVVVNASEKRYLWTARAFAVIVAISLCCNLVLILTIAQLIPLYRVEPFLLTFENKQEQVYDIVPLSNMENQKAITEVFVREYVLLRSAFVGDVQEMESRWMPGSQLQEMSSSAVYQAFIDKTAKRALDIIKNKGLIRVVRIMTVNELSRGLWQVEYETRDMYPDSSAPQVDYWTASLRIVYRKKTVKYGERLNNPIGFTVTGYSLSHNKVE
ncbi:MAG: type IV secretion system protein [Alphaproteobacteria bacterium]|nr:type IV secretion system protein [Alphaproteobacteria bacterium]